MSCILHGMKLNDIVIILSRPSKPGNIGAVCRAMKNMGLMKLRIASSMTQDEETITARAVHAADVWENAVHYSSLKEAVEDCSLVIGTTRRRGRKRKRNTMTARELSGFLRDYKGAEKSPAAIIFGNERTGLEDDEIELCNIASHIPVDESFPSINLSHAVQIYTYEIFQAMAVKNAVKGQWVPMEKTTMEGYAEKLTDSLKLLGFYRKVEQKEQEEFFRDIFSRAALTESEGQYFAKIISKAAHLAGKTREPGDLETNA